MSTESPHRPRRNRHSPAGSVIFGLLIVAFGLTLLANNLGFADVRHALWQFWPFFLIASGIALFFKSEEGQSHFSLWGSAMIVGGLWAFASQRGWIHLNFWAAFGPALLVLLGASVIWRAISLPRPEGSVDGNAYVHSFVVLSGSEHKPASTPFKGADLTAILGGVKLDLTGAEMEGDVATVDVVAVMGGIEIFVPRDWSVTSKVASFMGAYADKRRPATLPTTKTLIVRGSAVMGGIEVKD